MKNKSVFLTGAEGFIGSHMVESLVKKNFNVKALVLYNSFKDIGWLKTVNKKILKDFIKYCMGGEFDIL